MFRAFFRLFSLLFLIARFAAAQPLPDRAPIVGTARDSAGKPLEGALISLRRQDGSGAFTFWGAVAASDARGAWRFAQAEAGRYYLSAEVPGFAPISNQNVEWKAGDAPLQLRFERLVNLTLKVATPDGSPLANAPIWLRLRGDGSVGQITRRESTDETGTVVFDSLLPATYALFGAAPGGFASQSGVELRGNQSLEWTLQTGGALQIAVVEAAPRRVGATKRALGGATLSLTPENAAEAARSLGVGADLNENVALLAAGGDPLALLSRDGDGQISIASVPPGRYLARLNLPGYAAPAPQKVVVAGGKTAQLIFGLAPAATTPGEEPASGGAAASLTLDLRIKDALGAEKSAPIGEWAVRVLPIDENGALAPETNEGGVFSAGGNAARRALSDSGGQITLFPLAAGRYRVFVAPRTPPGTDPPEAASLDISVPASGAQATLVLPATSPAATP